MAADLSSRWRDALLANGVTEDQCDEYAAAFEHAEAEAALRMRSTSIQVKGDVAKAKSRHATHASVQKTRVTDAVLQVRRVPTAGAASPVFEYLRGDYLAPQVRLTARTPYRQEREQELTASSFTEDVKCSTVSMHDSKLQGSGYASGFFEGRRVAAYQGFAGITEGDLT